MCAYVCVRMCVWVCVVCVPGVGVGVGVGVSLVWVWVCVPGVGVGVGVGGGVTFLFAQGKKGEKDTAKRTKQRRPKGDDEKQTKPIWPRLLTFGSFVLDFNRMTARGSISAFLCLSPSQAKGTWNR